MREFLSSLIEKKYYLMLMSALFYVLGLVGFFSSQVIVIAFVLLVLGLVAIIKNYVSPKLVLFWYLMFLFGFFNASFNIKSHDELSLLAPQDMLISGQVTSIPTTGVPGKTKFFFNVDKVDGKQIEGRTLVTISGNDFSQLNIGDTYNIKGKLRAPFEATNPSQFDYGKYLQNFDTFSVFYASKYDCTELKTTLSPKWKFMQWLNGIRNDIIKVHGQYLKSSNLEILGGVVFGDDAIAPPDYVKASFMNSGLLHILAASGMNVALIYGIWFFILSKLRVPFRLNVGSGIFMVLFYALMTGLGASVIRAAFMLVFILIGKLIDRDAHSISLLAFVGLLMLIYNPAYINNVSFQLSFVVTFGLLLAAPIVAERTKGIPNILSGAIFVPIVAQIWVAPIQMYYFNSFSTYSVLANISILPFLTVISFGGFISAVLSLFKPIAHAVCYLFDLILNPAITVLVWLSDFFSSLPNSLLTTIQPNLCQIFIYYAIIFAITLLFKVGWHKKTAIILVGLLLGLFLTLIPVKNNKLEILAFDVQNADAMLIKTPEDKYFIIDSAKSGYMGGNSQAKFIILKYLKDRGIKNIEGLIVTHFDNDHSGGAVDLIENLNVKNVYISALEDKSKESQKIYAALSAHAEIKTHKAKNAQVIFEEPNLKIKTYSANLLNSDNENSIITLISYKNFDGLFMGDAGVVAYEKIKKDLPKGVEFLKVGHHGAKNVVNSTMLQNLGTKVALISTGPNYFGHPNQSTLDILDKNEIRVLRTDVDNAVKLVVDRDLKIYTFISNAAFNLSFVIKY